MTDGDWNVGTGHGHAPFAVLNRTANPIVRLILRSRAHRLLSAHLLLLTVTGRRSGCKHTLPVGYSEANGVLSIRVGAPERKRWWHNVGSETPVLVTLRGVDRRGLASVHGDERSGISVVIEPEEPGLH
jgi:hypothetical protein